ncbi:MAG: hypothetical protein K2X28_03245 [Alphaproteobacteria bacterium]|nr:hypothetical protein [Alphaproteobacteria bacterium]
MKTNLLLIAGTALLLSGLTAFAFNEGQDEVITGATLKGLANQIPNEEGKIQANGRTFGAMGSQIEWIKEVPDDATFTAQWLLKDEATGTGYWEIQGEVPPSASHTFTTPFSLIIDPDAEGY